MSATITKGDANTSALTQKEAFSVLVQKAFSWLSIEENVKVHLLQPPNIHAQDFAQ